MKQMPKCLAFLMLVVLTLTSCRTEATIAPVVESYYEGSFRGAFDEEYTVTAACADEQEFQYLTSVLTARLRYYESILSLKYESPYGNSLKILTDNAGISPVSLPPASINFLDSILSFTESTNAPIKVTAGYVSDYWNEWVMSLRNNEQEIAVPIEDYIANLGNDISDDNLLVDDEIGTAYILKKRVKLDLGDFAVAFATDEALKYLETLGFDRLQISTRKFASSVGEPLDSCWHFKMSDPTVDGTLSGLDRVLDTICLEDESIYFLTSAINYQEFEGQRYHNIISTDTLEPANNYLAVAVITDEGIAEAERLARALFVSKIDDSKSISDEFSEAEVLWVHYDGRIEVTDGFTDYMKRRGKTH